MTTPATLIAALKLPKNARIDTRIPKKTLVEQGAPTSADKKIIQDGLEELQWVAALKPNTVAIPSFSDATGDYSEIAVLAATFRPNARSARLTELIHRAIPYPVLLAASAHDGGALSVAPKRAAQNEAGKTVVERMVQVTGLSLATPSLVENAFMHSLALEGLTSANLRKVYWAWLARIEALVAARLSGVYSIPTDDQLVESRRKALAQHSRLTKEMAQLRSEAKKAQQISQKVTLNQRIKALEAEIDANSHLIRGATP